MPDTNVHEYIIYNIYIAYICKQIIHLINLNLSSSCNDKIVFILSHSLHAAHYSILLLAQVQTQWKIASNTYNLNNRHPFNIRKYMYICHSVGIRAFCSPENWTVTSNRRCAIAITIIITISEMNTEIVYVPPSSPTNYFRLYK